MKRSTRYIKKALVTFLVVLMSINTFAAVVGDNDGAAFITKAEFDSLKNDFQSQLDRYNSSIDNKIDGAIASYLAGVSIKKQVELTCPVKNYNEIHWVNGLYGKTTKRIWNTTTTYTDTSYQYNEYVFDKRRSLRNGRIALYWGYANNMNATFWQFTGGNAYAYKSAIYNEDGMIYHGGDATGWGFPRVLNIWLTKNDDGDWVINRTRAGVTSPFISCEYSFRDTAAGVIQGPKTVPSEWLTINSNPEIAGGAYKLIASTDGVNGTYTRYYPTTTDYFLYDQRWTSANPTSATGTDTSGTGYRINASNFNLAEPDGETATFTSNWSWSETLLGEDPTPGITITDWKVNGGTTQINSDQNNQTYMLLGRDTSLQVNYVKKVDDLLLGMGTTGDWSDSKVAPYEISGTSISCWGGSYITSRPYWGASPIYYNTDTSASTNVTLNFPLFSRATISELKTDKYKVSGKALKLGQGIPMIQESGYDGVMHLKIEYEKKTADVAVTTLANQNVVLSLKKSDFCDSNKSNYATDESGGELKNKNYTSSPISLDIPIKKDESIWFRIGSDNLNPSGEYVILKNLSIVVES